jgi:hypothetical protein
MSNKKLHHELETLDAAIAELEACRTELINRMSSSSRNPGFTKILHFPDSVSVRRSPRGSTTRWPKGSEVKPPGKG